MNTNYKNSSPLAPPWIILKVHSEAFFSTDREATRHELDDFYKRSEQTSTSDAI